MSRVLYRLSRRACPPADRPWVDALFAELEAVEPGRDRLLWLLGAAGLLLDRYVRLLSFSLSRASLICLAAALTFGWLAIIEYEGLAVEDDWYGPVAALSTAALVCVSFLNLRRQATHVRP